MAHQKTGKKLLCLCRSFMWWKWSARPGVLFLGGLDWLTNWEWTSLWMLQSRMRGEGRYWGAFHLVTPYSLMVSSVTKYCDWRLTCKRCFNLPVLPISLVCKAVERDRARRSIPGRLQSYCTHPHSTQCKDDINLPYLATESLLTQMVGDVLLYITLNALYYVPLYFTLLFLCSLVCGVLCVCTHAHHSQWHMITKNVVGIFLKRLRSRVMVWTQATRANCQLLCAT